MIDEHVENWRGYVQYKARLKARQMGRLDMAPDLYSQGLQAVWYAFQKWDPQRLSLIHI